MMTLMEARLRFYLRAQFEDSGEWHERRISRPVIRQLLTCIQTLQTCEAAKAFGFREADLLCKVDEDEIMIEWLGGKQVFSLLVTPEAVSAMLLSTSQDGLDVQHSSDITQVRELFEAFCILGDE